MSTVTSRGGGRSVSQEPSKRRPSMHRLGSVDRAVENALAEYYLCEAKPKKDRWTNCKGDYKGAVGKAEDERNSDWEARRRFR